MSDARSAILARLRQGQRTGRIPMVEVRGGPAPGRVESRDAIVDRFLRELTALGVEHHVESSPAAVRARVSAIVDGQSVLSWDPALLPYDVGSVLKTSIDGRSPRDQQAAAEIGVTGCDAAIAETGTLVLLSGEGKPRAASLLPRVHLALVRKDDLRGSMDEFFRERAGDVASASCCTAITGPSRTADIELTLTLGVHGPGTVIVVVGP